MAFPPKGKKPDLKVIRRATKKQRRGTIKGHETNKRNKTSVYDPKIQKLGRLEAKKQGKGFWDPKIQSLGGRAANAKKNKEGKSITATKGGKAGAPAANKINRKNKTGFWDPKVQRLGRKACAKWVKKNPREAHKNALVAGKASAEWAKKNPKKASENGANAAHQRWHEARGLKSKTCKLCRKQK